ncbi:MAG TPA: hypothetical protein VGO11_00655 [Chthoniobacteraceae bacterium]|jgi:hypothetical protein|nr:hypothetical protein [Chthoniobacteraceae bacterium]
MRRYWERLCTGRLWRRRFPVAQKTEIREFLQIFIVSFGFDAGRRLCFAPDDRIMDVYASLYPGRGGADRMELESLFISVEERYHIELPYTLSDDMTLGELFTQSRPSAV